MGRLRRGLYPQWKLPPGRRVAKIDRRVGAMGWGAPAGCLLDVDDPHVADVPHPDRQILGPAR